MVAPARERGLKFRNGVAVPGAEGRSREGAWIEIPSERAMVRQEIESLPRGSVD